MQYLPELREASADDSRENFDFRAQRKFEMKIEPQADSFQSEASLVDAMSAQAELA